MGTQDISVELQSLVEATTALNSKVIPEIDSLAKNFQSYLQDLKPDEWTEESAAYDYGRTYMSAVAAYDQVIQGIQKDIHRYRDELVNTHRDYVDQDDAVLEQMNRRLAKLDDVNASDDMGRAAYGQRPNLDDGKPEAPRPDDTSPEVKD